MTNQLRAVELDFLKDAPNRWDFEAEVHAPPKVVFAAIAADPSTWARWFPGLQRGSYEGDGQPGVGTSTSSPLPNSEKHALNSACLVPAVTTTFDGSIPPRECIAFARVATTSRSGRMPSTCV